MKKQILFVDDEIKILKGLQRMLRPMRKEWDTYFLTSGEDALIFLAKQHVDVVVSDIRMPGINGVQFLIKVKKKYPGIVRIILSGFSEQEIILKSVRPAHQYLSKPCDPDTLKHRVSRACSLRDLLENQELKQAITKIDVMPSLPHLYEQIMDELQSPAPSIQRIGEIISQDPGMTMKILQLVNSAFFGIPCRISNPAQAITMLGLDLVKALILSSEIFSSFKKQNSLNINKLWNHSLASAVIGKEIAKIANLEKIEVEDSFLACLLHDIGKAVLCTKFPELYKKVNKLKDNEGLSTTKVEQLVFGATHADVGAYLL
jgi:response regulator RpfG family c-di-GMP phosphodiesterase